MSDQMTNTGIMCPHRNEGVICGPLSRRCQNCGWNPSVEKWRIGLLHANFPEPPYMTNRKPYQLILPKAEETKDES